MRDQIGRKKKDAEKPIPAKLLPFLTGSHVYGEPHEESDIDLVIFLPPDQVGPFKEAYGRMLDDVLEVNPFEKAEEYGRGSLSLRFGPLNLIICTELIAYYGFLAPTNELKRMAEERKAPITREEAVEVFKNIRAAIANEEVE